MFKDLRYAIRSLWRQPGFAIITVLTLALGIGANTAVFSVVNGVLLRPLPYPEPERLEFITSKFPGLAFNQFWISPPEFLEFRDHNQAFESVGAYVTGAVNFGTSPPSRPVSAQVTPEFMPTLGVQPFLGRWLTAADSVPNAPPVVVLSWELWQGSLGGAPIVGQTVQINNRATEVVGIMPKGYDVHDQRVEVWQPFVLDPATLPNRRGNHLLYLVGRRKPGVSHAEALADVNRLVHQWRQIVPNGHVPSPDGHPYRLDPLQEDIVGGVRQALVVLQAAVAFVLLIACANLANLIIARADSRMREYAVRSALGASWTRMLRQLITEGLVLAFAAAVIGIGLAWGGLTLLVAAYPNGIPRMAEITLDQRVMLFTTGVAALTGLIFGLVPMTHVARGRVGTTLKDSGGRTTAGTVRARLRSALVVAEVALAVLLVVGAGLLIRSFANLMRVDLGFNRAQMTTFGLVLPAPTYDATRRLDVYQRLTTSLKALPGSRSVAAMTGLPPFRQVNANDTDFEHIPDTQGPPTGEFPPQNVDYYQYVSVGYSDTMGIPVVSGRTFEEHDTTGPPVVLVNETLAKRFFRDRDPLGQRVKPGFGAQLPWFTIVGVLKDVKQGGVSAETGTELYMLSDQMPRTLNFAPGGMNFVVRSDRSMSALGPELRRAVAEIDPALPLIRMRTMEDVIGDSVARPRFLTTLLGIFAGIALALAAVGTYGILAYLVTERRQEIGIRMALGADQRTILRLVLVRGLLLSGIGLAIGLAGSLLLSRVLGTLLFNVPPNDPVTLALVAGVIAVVGAAACLVPAWRATRTDPLIALRAE